MWLLLLGMYVALFYFITSKNIVYMLERCPDFRGDTFYTELRVKGDVIHAATCVTAKSRKSCSQCVCQNWLRNWLDQFDFSLTLNHNKYAFLTTVVLTRVFTKSSCSLYPDMREQLAFTSSMAIYAAGMMVSDTYTSLLAGTKPCM
jgi:hypothetical protein